MSGPIIDFTSDDILQSTVVTPGWYRVHIGDFVEEPTKDGKSTNYVFRPTNILRSEDNGSEEFAGVPIRLSFSAKPTARGFLTGFFAALGGDLKPGARFRISDAAGKEIVMFIGNKTLDDGRPVNDPKHNYKKAE